jgi:hypothetical protein
MVDAIKTFFIAIGVFTVVFMVYILAYGIINKFNRWRKNGCKIKCLCKPHVYEIEWHWVNDGKTLLVCKKCGKKKTLFIDFDSFRK